MEFTYRKIEIDNPVCNRRFHIAFEEREKGPRGPVSIACPHCGVTIFEHANMPPAILTREENLVKTPNGSRPIVQKCQLREKTSN